MQGVFSSGKDYLNTTVYSSPDGRILYSIATTKGLLGGRNLTTIKDSYGIAGAIHWKANKITVGKREFPFGEKVGFFGRCCFFTPDICNAY